MLSLVGIGSVPYRTHCVVCEHVAAGSDTSHSAYSISARMQPNALALPTTTVDIACEAHCRVLAFQFSLHANSLLLLTVGTTAVTTVHTTTISTTTGHTSAASCLPQAVQGRVPATPTHI
jgi:hypothetical protein